MRRPGVIPPGRIGLVVIAAAMVPVVVRKFPDVVRWLGKKIESSGARLSKTADEVERYERERQERVEKEEARVNGKSTAVKVEAEMVEKPGPAKATAKAKPPKKVAAPKPPKKARKKADLED